MSGLDPGWLDASMQWWTYHLPYSLAIVYLVVSAAWLALLAHELGHALMAWFLGVRVWSISLGRGPVLWDRPIGGCRVRIALFPVHGEVRFHDTDAEGLGYPEAAVGNARFEWREGSSWRAPLISAAGTLANLLSAKAVVAFWATDPKPDVILLKWTMAIFLVNAFMLLNLMPLRGFDGWRIAIQAAAWRRRPTTNAID